MPAFHETRFPTDVALGSRGGPSRQTDIVVLRSGFEERNSTWTHSRRKFNAGYGIKHLQQLERVIAFFEERRGKLYGFRWKDKTDFRSVIGGQNIGQNDQLLGVGNGTTTVYQLIKTYGTTFAPYARLIKKPVNGTVLVAVNNIKKIEGTDYTIDYTTGLVTFVTAPPNAQNVTAGFEYDVPVRFDTDYIEIDLSNFEAGQIPNIPIIEIRV